MTSDRRIDAYIAKAAPFAQPILIHLRTLVHEALQGVEEGIKWGMPHFLVGGKNVAGIAAFKAHCALVLHGGGHHDKPEGEGMGGYGKVASLADLPSDDDLRAALRASADHVVANPRARSTPRPEPAMPADFAEALGNRRGAREAFAAFAPGARREYIEWIAGAKRPETRARRVAKAAAQVAEGRKLNWKFEKR